MLLRGADGEVVQLLFLLLFLLHPTSEDVLVVVAVVDNNTDAVMDVDK